MAMSNKLILGFQQAQKLPTERQEELGQMLLDATAQDASDVRLSDEQVAEVKRRLAQPSRRVPEAEMEAFFKKFA